MQGNGNTAGFFFRRVVNIVDRLFFFSKTLEEKDVRQSRGQGSLAVVNVSNCSDVYVRFSPHKLFFFCHFVPRAKRLADKINIRRSLRRRRIAIPLLFKLILFDSFIINDLPALKLRRGKQYYDSIQTPPWMSRGLIHNSIPTP